MTYKLLSAPNANPKVNKNAALGYLTAPLHLAPFNLSGVMNVCPKATVGCAAACLHTAGNPAYMQGKTSARIRKTKLFHLDRQLFINQLIEDIERLRRAAKRAGLKPAVRLNATSDLSFERFAPELFTKFHDVIFYDYTKVYNRIAKHAGAITSFLPLPKNYSFTLSWHEKLTKREQEIYAATLIAQRANVAVVFSGRKLPNTWDVNGLSFPVVDGDLSDCRFLDPRGVIVGLRAKGLTTDRE